MPQPSNLARRAQRLAALNEAALAIAGDLDLDRVLEKILTTAARLVGARYGALGIPDRHGGFGRFLTVGISEQRAARIGALPRVHGVLGSLVTDGKRPARSTRCAAWCWRFVRKASSATAWRRPCMTTSRDSGGSTGRPSRHVSMKATGCRPTSNSGFCASLRRPCTTRSSTPARSRFGSTYGTQPTPPTWS